MQCNWDNNYLQRKTSFVSYYAELFLFFWKSYCANSYASKEQRRTGENFLHFIYLLFKLNLDVDLLYYIKEDERNYKEA